MENLAKLRATRGALSDQLVALTAHDVMTPEQVTEYDKLEKQIGDLDAQIERVEKAQKIAAKSAVAVVDPANPARKAAAAAKQDPYEKDPTLTIGGMAKMLLLSKQVSQPAFDLSAKMYGESHPVTDAIGFSQKAMITGNGAAGGFIVPPDFNPAFIELLRARTAVRKAGPMVLPMDRGTMQIPKQTGAATASYGAEAKPITASKPAVGMVQASFKKLSGFVPISNDMIRYANPGVDRIVRDDLVRVIGLTEDLNFIRGDGTADSPKGFRTFVPSSQVIASTDAYTLSTVVSELGGAINKLETANVDMTKPAWIMHPRTKNYLWWVQNANGFFVFRDELNTGKLSGIPFFLTTQIPVNLSNGTHSDCSELYLVDMDQAMILDSQALQLAVSTEAYFTDESGSLVSAFQSDLSVIRAITEHDFQMRHDEAIAVIDKVRWAPALT